MQSKFFIRRFLRYFLLLIIPTFLVFMISFFMVNIQIDDSLDTRAKNTLSNVNTNLNFVVSNVVFQNSQLTNNPYTLVSLKKLLRQDSFLSLSDAIYHRNIKTMLNSIIQVYPYIQSVYLYLDGFDRYFSSVDGIVDFQNKEEFGWWRRYSRMAPDMDNSMEARTMTINGKERQVLTIYQRMLLQDGVVVMNIDVDKYRAQLDSILTKDFETVLYVNEDNEILFSWNDRGDGGAAFDLRQFDRTVQENTWVSMEKGKYLVHTAYNNQYKLHLVSLLSRQAKTEELWQQLQIFCMIFAINSMAMVILAYATTKRTFSQLHYMIQVFHDAESGIYPSQPRQEMKDEYDVIMNNIIYLFLQTVKLNGDLLQKQHEKQVAELTALQLQINPHFLFNTLQTVELEIRKPEASREAAKRVLDDLSDILKYALADPLETISLKQEIEYLKKYVAIQKFRFGDRFIMYYEIEEGLLKFQVFRLMLQPLVENSILHGIRYSKERGYIKLQIFGRRGRVYFRVVDNGEGMTKEECRNLRESIKVNQLTHIGLSNVNSRLILHFGMESGLRIRSKKGMGCVMEFSLPKEGVCMANKEASLQ